MEQVHLDTAVVSQGVALGHDSADGRAQVMTALLAVREEIESRWHGEAKMRFSALYQLLDEDQAMIRTDGSNVTEATDLAMRDTVVQDADNAQLFGALTGTV